VAFLPGKRSLVNSTEAMLILFYQYLIKFINKSRQPAGFVLLYL
jgi:hypothetical protein